MRQIGLYWTARNFAALSALCEMKTAGGSPLSMPHCDKFWPIT